MNKTAIKNFAVWARRKLISEVTYKAGLMGISESGILSPLSNSTDNIEFYDIGTGKPTELSGTEVKQRKALVSHIKEKERSSDYKTAFQFVLEEVAYTWFNRLVAIRFMEVNEYLPSGVRVLSSERKGKAEPDMVTTPFETDMAFSAYETDKIVQLKDENKLDELFRMLFIKQCNKLNEVLPELFEKTSDYTELLLNIAFTDKDGIVSHLVGDIDEDDFKKAVEVIGWLYQYYNTEPKEQVIDIFKGMAIKKEDIPAATQIFTTDWVVRYMVDNSLGRYWIERNPDSKLAEKLAYFVMPKDGSLQYANEKVTPEELTFFDPCMGSGHILVYAFDVLMEIYRESGYVDRDAAQAIIENNLFGLDIDERAYQLAYFAVMMKAISYDKRFLTRDISPKVYPIYDYTKVHTTENADLNYLIDEFSKAKQYGSLINFRADFNLESIKRYLNNQQGQITMNSVDFIMISNVIMNTEVLLKKYAIVCTNPPYLNKMNGELKEYITKHYKDYSGDLFSVFMYKNFDYCKQGGYSAFMTPNVWMFIKTYEKLRDFIVSQKFISSLIQIAKGAFYKEATVDVMGFVLKNAKENKKGLYIRLEDFKGDMEVQKQKVLEALANKDCGYFYETSAENFSKIPGSPIAYWVSENVLDTFRNPTMGYLAKPRQGMATTNNNLFLRLWYEIKNTDLYLYAADKNEALSSGKKWFPYNKGGEFRKWFGNNDFVVDWYNDGEAIKKYLIGKNPNIPRSESLYFKKCFSWSLISSGSAAFRFKPQGNIFDIAGMSCFSEEILFYLLGLANTPIVLKFLEVLAPTINFQAGDIANIPVVISEEHKSHIEELVEQNISISKTDWDSFETSWDFTKHPLVHNSSIQSAFEAWELECTTRFTQLKDNEEEINRIFIDIYGLQDELTPEVADKDVTVRKADLARDIKSLVSYAVGCIFGRYSLDVDGLAYAGGDWDSTKYRSFIPDMDNCIPITDEEYFEDDMVGLFVAFVKKVYGVEILEENLDFIAKALGNKGSTARETIRAYFLKDFYKDHVKTYQKRPIYWLYDSGKQDGFKALVYMHRYNADTTGKVRVEYLHKMQKTYMSEIDRMQDEIENGKSSADISKAEKRKEKLVKQLKETKDYDEKIAHLALSRIAIDLDDGVKVNYEKVQTAQDGKVLDILGKI